MSAYSSTAVSTTADMKAALDAALTSSGQYTRVTTGYVGTPTTKILDVWENTAKPDGYTWFLIVATDNTVWPGRVLLSGALEYSDSTKIAKKALRGIAAVGFVDPAGYPLVSSGGVEMTFALASFTPTFTATVGNLGGISSGAQANAPAALPAGGIFRVLVTGQVVWVWWGTATAATHCHGVGTYQRLSPIAQDLKPLGFLAFGQYPALSNDPLGGSVWQHPSATQLNQTRNTSFDVLNVSGSGATHLAQWTRPIGYVGAGGADIHYGDTVIGSRLHVTRNLAIQASSMEIGGVYLNTAGWSLGLAPADFLLCGRTASVAVGDTVGLGGKTYVSVSPAAASPGLFVNTQPT